MYYLLNIYECVFNITQDLITVSDKVYLALKLLIKYIERDETDT